MRTLYRAAAQVVHRLPLRGVLGESLAGRRGAAERWTAWAAQLRTGGPLGWFHAASVGEAQAVTSVLERLRRARSDLQLVLTCSSPSLARWPGRLPVARTDFVPLDEPRAVAETLTALRPAFLCFSRGDLWPELVRAAADRNIPVVVTGAVMGPGSARAGKAGRALLGPLHRTLHEVGAASAADASRWIRAGAPADRVRVTGDPRHDTVFERECDIRPVRALTEWTGARRVLVAGSLEPEDLAPLFAAVMAARKTASGRLLAVPHDPGRAPDVVRAAQGAGLEADVWSGPPHQAPDRDVLVVDALGLLADLYLAGDVAYVGGGFQKGRLHCVVEPAALALPVLAGPDLAADRDGAAILAAGGARLLSPHALAAWLADPALRHRDGVAGRGALTSGAATRAADTLLSILPGL